MTSLYLFLVLLGLLGALVYLLVFFREVPGAVEERLGEWEQLPRDLGIWSVDAEWTQSTELRREVRYLWQPAEGLFGSDRLIRQVRYRGVQSGSVEQVEPEEVLKRRRVRKR